MTRRVPERNGGSGVRRILLLGGASEIGLAIVTECLRDGGADVVLAGRASSPHRADAELAVRRAGARGVEWIDFDAAEPASHPQVIAQVFTRPVDIVIVAFGLLGDAGTWRDHAEAVRVAQTNYTGALSVGVLLGQAMRAQGHGQVVALSSVAGERVRRSNPVYGSSKAGMDGFYLQLGVLLEGSGVRVLVVRPGAVRGRMTAGRRVPLSTTPERVARATVAAMRRGRRMIRVPALFGPIMGVYRHLPASVAKRLAF